MKKRYFNVYILIVIAALSLMIFSIYSIRNTIQTNKDELVFVDSFIYNNQINDMKEQRIEVGSAGLHVFEASLDADLNDKINDDAILIVPRLRGLWHKIYFNNQLIGMIGTEDDKRMHVWNAVYKFVIPDNLIRERNTIRFESYSEYKIGYSSMPIFIGNTILANRLYDKLESIYEDFYLVVIGMLTALAVMEIFLFLLTQTYDRRFILIPLSVLLICVYLLDYTVLSHGMFSALTFKKIIVFCFHSSAFVLSIAFASIYNFKWIKHVANIFIAGSLIGAILAPDLLVYSTFYNLYNIFVLALIVSWIFMALKAHSISNSTQDYMIGVTAIFLLIPTIYDSIVLQFYSGRYMRIAVYGIIFYGLAMLMIAIVNYIEYQKDIFSETRLLEQERLRLEHALITDELTGLNNHRHFYDLFEKILEGSNQDIYIIMLDIDKFRPINEIKGHTVGDEILKSISTIIKDEVGEQGHIFRYGGEEFVVLFYGSQHEAFQTAEAIRVGVIEDKAIHDLSGYLPLTLSIGISTTPKDGLSPRALVIKAEKAVTYAKFRGRNKVVVYHESIEKQMEGSDVLEIKDKLLIDFIYTLAGVIDMKDEYTGKHSEEVARYAMLIAEELDINDKERFALRLGGLLHDFGKLSIPDTIICKNGGLTDDEFAMIKTHPIKGYDIVKHIVDDPLVLQCVKSHHERVDGKGYPEGLKGDDIPLLSRIVCVADAYHAMISTRSYRKARSQEYAMDELKKCSGDQFDPQVVQAFIKAMEK